MSIRLLAAFAALAAPFAANAAPPVKSVYYGRWTVAEDRPAFSRRGALYRTIDVAPCGNDFCGISVGASGRCGPTLFRFFGFRAASEELLYGHGRWGEMKKNIQVGAWRDEHAPGGRVMELYLGDGHDFGERSANMPKFHAAYRPAGAALCMRQGSAQRG